MAPVAASQDLAFGSGAESLAAGAVERNKWHPHVAQKYRVDFGEGE